MANNVLRPGQRVIWWKRASASRDCPIRGVVRAAADQRIKIEIDRPDGDSNPVIRHVAAARVQEIRRHYFKSCEHPSGLKPIASWGAFYRYGEIAEDLYISRQVDVFANGYALCYDRDHLVDDFGMLGSLRFCRFRWEKAWGPLAEIEQSKFEQIWRDAQ